MIFPGRFFFPDLHLVPYALGYWELRPKPSSDHLGANVNFIQTYLKIILKSMWPVPVCPAGRKPLASQVPAKVSPSNNWKARDTTYSVSS